MSSESFIGFPWRTEYGHFGTIKVLGKSMKTSKFTWDPRSKHGIDALG